MKTLTHQFVGIALISILAAFSAIAAESLSVLLQKGIYAEETEGNLDAAIKIYEGIVKDSDANRTLVAQAQYRLGVCQMKRGKKDEAEAAFRAIIARPADQTELAAKARDRLAELGRSVSSAVVRQIWSGAAASGDSISSDGRYLSFVDWNSGNLAVRDLMSGQNRQVTDTASLRRTPSHFAEWDILSPDGKQLAYSWWTGGGSNRYQLELRILLLNESKPRVLLTKTNGWFSPAAWSPKEAAIAVVIGTGQRPPLYEYEISLVSAKDGAVRELKTLGRREPVSVHFSPDGRHLAYSCRSENVHEGDIFLLDLMNGAERGLIEHPADDKLIGWTPDGTGVLFSSNRRGSVDLWLAQVANGKPAEEPVLLKADLGQISSVGLTSKGEFYYKVSAQSFDFYAASVDFDTGKLLSPPRKIPTRYAGLKRPVRFARDGSRLVYVSQRGSRSVLHVLDLESEREREFEDFPDAIRHHTPWWLSDNQTLLFRSVGNDGSLSLFLFNTVTGGVKPIIKVDPDSTLEWGQAVDEKALFYVRKDVDRKKFILIRHDFQTGQETKEDLLDIANPNWHYAFRFREDRRWLVYVCGERPQSDENPGHLFLRNLGTGEEFELRHSGASIGFDFIWGDPLSAVVTRDRKAGVQVRFIDIRKTPPHEQLSVRLLPRDLVGGWASDHRYFLFQRIVGESNDRSTELWTISTSNGELKRTELSVPGMQLVGNIHVLGERVYVQAGGSPLNEIWVMENFLPSVAAAK